MGYVTMELARELAGICDTLLKHHSSINPDALDPDTLEANCTMGAVKILELKEAHFGMCQATEELKQSTTEAMNRLDESSLHLDNLLYEKNHYEREIQSCKSYRSAYTDEQLELLPAEEYAARSTDMETKTLILSEDPHTAMLARLEEELKYREEVLRDLEALKVKRDALAAQLAQRRDTMAGLQSDIANLRSSAQQIQTKYESVSNSIAKLPGPLYMLYSNAAAIAALLDLPVTMSIVDSSGDHGDDSPGLSIGQSHPCAVQFTLLSKSPGDSEDRGVDDDAMVEDGENSKEPLVIILRYFPHAHTVAINAKDDSYDHVLKQLFEKDNSLAEKDESANGWVVNNLLSLHLFPRPDSSLDPLPLDSIPCGPRTSLGAERSLQACLNILSFLQKLMSAT